MKVSTLRIMLALVLALTMFVGSVSPVSAAKLPDTYEGYTRFGRHYYKSITFAQAKLWSECSISAQQHFELNGRWWDGHLAVITSARENAFVAGLVQTAGAYIGGRQDYGAASPSESWWWWRIKKSEKWRYTNWNSGEPNDSDGTEDGDENFLMILQDGTWNDLPNGPHLTEMIVEMERRKSH